MAATGTFAPKQVSVGTLVDPSAGVTKTLGDISNRLQKSRDTEEARRIRQGQIDIANERLQLAKNAATRADNQYKLSEASNRRAEEEATRKNEIIKYNKDFTLNSADVVRNSPYFEQVTDTISFLDNKYKDANPDSEEYKKYQKQVNDLNEIANAITPFQANVKSYVTKQALRDLGDPNAASLLASTVASKYGISKDRLAVINKNIDLKNSALEKEAQRKFQVDKANMQAISKTFDSFKNSKKPFSKLEAEALIDKFGFSKAFDASNFSGLNKQEIANLALDAYKTGIPAYKIKEFIGDAAGDAPTELFGGKLVNRSFDKAKFDKLILDYKSNNKNGKGTVKQLKLSDYGYKPTAHVTLQDYNKARVASKIRKILPNWDSNKPNFGLFGDSSKTSSNTTILNDASTGGTTKEVSNDVKTPSSVLDRYSGISAAPVESGNTLSGILNQGRRYDNNKPTIDDIFRDKMFDSYYTKPSTKPSTESDVIESLFQEKNRVLSDDSLSETEKGKKLVNLNNEIRKIQPGPLKDVSNRLRNIMNDENATVTRSAIREPFTAATLEAIKLANGSVDIARDNVAIPVGNYLEDPNSTVGGLLARVPTYDSENNWLRNVGPKHSSKNARSLANYMNPPQSEFAKKSDLEKLKYIGRKLNKYWNKNVQPYLDENTNAILNKVWR